MATGWFIVPYKRRADPARVVRYCAVDDVTPQIRADGGDWTETEVLGQVAVVKVRASVATLGLVTALPGASRLPVDRLDDPLSSLTAPQKNVLRNRVLALGYTAADVTAALPGDLGSHTLRDLLGFVASRRRLVRYDQPTDTVIDDGPDQPVRPIDHVDAAVV